MRPAVVVAFGALLALTGCTPTRAHPGAASTYRPPTTASAPITGTAPALTSDAKPLADASCSRHQLTMRFSGSASPMTGEHSAFVTVWNVSHDNCRLPVYPTVALSNGRHPLPFRFQDNGVYIQDRPGARIVLRPGAAANFLVAKYRCDVGDMAAVTAITVSIRPDSLSIGFPAGDAGPTLAYCKAYRGPAATDPGNTVEIGPYVRGEAHGI